MEKKKSGLSGIFTVVIVIFLAVRIAMIAGRSNTTWNSGFLIWSVFLLFAVIGGYFWNKRKKQKEGE